MPRVLGGPRGVRIFYERGTHVRILQKSFRSLKLQRTSSTFGRSPTIDGQWNKSCWKVLCFFKHQPFQCNMSSVEHGLKVSLTWCVKVSIGSFRF